MEVLPCKGVVELLKPPLWCSETKLCGCILFHLFGCDNTHGFSRRQILEGSPRTPCP